ncbi:zinc finger protein 420-like [Neodiprion virginianus]|uniref:zinc finger protein 420-like n=1 Tax=Neodiprion virginianus TaxID=2961670 RepID=UPI001EE6FB8A|nr:zinc finger protein 420-like [Neodiprion virginianus]
MDVSAETSVSRENLDDVCRVCLSSDPGNEFIFRNEAKISNTNNTFTLSEKLQLYGGIEIWEDDGLPAKICTLCISKISVAHDFRDQCQRADQKLRKLYGKPAGRNTLKLSSSFKDQYCQTDSSLSCVKKEEEVSITEEETKMQQNVPISNRLTTEIQVSPWNNSTEDIEVHEHKILQDINVDVPQAEREKSSVKRESYRTRRVSMFKRMTSMENLKSHKERQRQYIKKNTSSKVESIEQDYSSVKRMTRNRVTRSMEYNLESELSHKCSKCNRSYSTKKSLERHALTHDSKKFKCDKCGKEFFRLDKLVEHSKLHVSKLKPEPVYCKICDKHFRKIDTMVRHLNVHKKANPREVFTILKEIRDRRKAENEIKNCIEDGNSGIKIVKAEPSNQESSSGDEEISKRLQMSNDNQDYNPDSLNSDSQSESETDSFNNLAFYRCKHCTKCYSTKKSLQRHMLIHDEKKFVCNVCNMKFFRPDRLKSHRNRYGHDEDKECLEPQKPPDDKSAIKLINSWIREELDSDNEGKGFPCEICGKSYVTKKSLQKHKANMHENREDFCDNCKADKCKCAERVKNIDKKNEKLKPFSCDECNKSFEKESKLEKHLRSHERAKEQQDSNFKRFLCHICSKTFRQNTGLMFHMRTHTGYKPHVCKYCGRGFTSNSNCINHERTHTGDRPFVCHFCSAAFAKSCTLKAHITTHTGEANYHCKTCGKSFRRLKYLKEHRFTHTGEKPYACKICGTAYSHSGSLFVHEKKCKAQYSNYQAVSEQNAQNYTQSPTGLNTSSVMAPIIPMLSSSHHLNNANNSLGGHANKNYVESMQRMNAHAAAVAAVGNPALHMHPNPEVSEMASAVRNFAIIGQIFHS